MLHKNDGAHKSFWAFNVSCGIHVDIVGDGDLAMLCASQACLLYNPLRESSSPQTLVQRLKSVELGLSGNTEAANAVQLIGLKEFGLTNASELTQAQKYLKGEFKMAERARSLRS